MNARSDYPWPVGDAQQAIKQHAVMCREIDRLRSELTLLEHAVAEFYEFVQAEFEPQAWQHPVGDYVADAAAGAAAVRAILRHKAEAQS